MRLTVDIEKKLGKFRLRAAFDADDGVTALLGASGCGKSMTLKCIAGVERPDAGYIALDGVTLFDSRRRINLPPQKRQVGYLFQNYALFPNMTVRQNILCGLHAEKDRAARERLASDAAARMRLTELSALYPRQLSGGQQQRAALARILASRPKLLMLDEPFSALDSHLREKLQLETRALLSAYEGPSLLVTHSRDEAYRLSDSIALMESGRILTVKPTKLLFTDPGSVAAAVMTGCKNIAPAVRVSKYSVDVPEWGVRFQTEAPVGEGLAAVGVRAHDFSAQSAKNRFPISTGEPVEEPFELIVPFRFAGQSPDAPELWWRIPKDRLPQTPVRALGAAPASVLLLYADADGTASPAR